MPRWLKAIKPHPPSSLIYLPKARQTDPNLSDTPTRILHPFPALSLYTPFKGRYKETNFSQKPIYIEGTSLLIDTTFTRTQTHTHTLCESGPGSCVSSSSRGLQKASKVSHTVVHTGKGLY